MKLIGDLNKLYCSNEALYTHDFEPEGFEWIDCHDASQSIISYQRKAKDKFLIVVLNFTPVPRENYRIGVPCDGTYHEILNSDSEFYGGSNLGNGQRLIAEPVSWMNQPHSLNLSLPPLGAIIIQRDDG